MAHAETELEIDWMACELIESVPAKVSGRPVVRGTRILPDAIANSASKDSVFFSELAN